MPKARAGLSGKAKTELFDQIAFAVLNCRALSVEPCLMDWANIGVEPGGKGAFGSSDLLVTNPETQFTQSFIPNVPIGHKWGSAGAQAIFRSIFRSDTAVDTIASRWPLGFNALLARVLPKRVTLVASIACEQVPDEVLAQEFYKLLKDRDVAVALVEFVRAISKFTHAITTQTEKATRSKSKAVSFSAMRATPKS